MPLIMDLDDERLEERARRASAPTRRSSAPIKGATYTAAKTATLDTLVAMGRCSDLLVLGRPGADPENVAPATVEAAHLRMRPRRHDRAARPPARGRSAR